MHLYHEINSNEICQKQGILHIIFEIPSYLYSIYYVIYTIYKAYTMLCVLYIQHILYYN